MEIKWIQFENLMEDSFQSSKEKKDDCLHRNKNEFVSDCAVAIKLKNKIIYWFAFYTNIYDYKVDDSYLPCTIIRRIK